MATSGEGGGQISVLFYQCVQQIWLNVKICILLLYISLNYFIKKQIWKWCFVEIKELLWIWKKIISLRKLTNNRIIKISW